MNKADKILQAKHHLRAAHEERERLRTTTNTEIMMNPGQYKARVNDLLQNVISGAWLLAEAVELDRPVVLNKGG